MYSTGIPSLLLTSLAMNSTKLNTPTELLVGPTPDKRGRGRPRKYPIGESPSERLKAARENGVQRGRGRPRKTPIDPNAAVAKPQPDPTQIPLPDTSGRPGPVPGFVEKEYDEKDPGEVMLAHFDELEAHGLLGSENSSSGDEPLQLPPTPIKRGRGRPPKNPKNGTTATTISPAQLQKKPPAPKQKVGKKDGQDSPISNHPLAVGSNNGRAKRGRPRKIPL